MDVNRVGSAQTQVPAANTQTKQSESSSETAVVKNEQTTNQDVVVERGSEKSTISIPDANAVLKESHQHIEAFKKMVAKLVENQGKKTRKSALFEEDPMIDIDPETRAAAQEAISEDGYFGVKQTSERILSFAKALGGNDLSKFTELKNAIIEGFKQAEEAWGGGLPDICNKTRDAVMKGLDEWEKELRGAQTQPKESN